jgi:hypothetical protein
VFVPAGNAERSAFALEFNLGGRYFVDPEASSGIYVGGGVGYRTVAVDGDSMFGGSREAGGAGAYAGLGVVFLRHADVHIILDARFDVNFFELQGSGGAALHGILVTVGFTFKGFIGRRWFL